MWNRFSGCQLPKMMNKIKMIISRAVEIIVKFIPGRSTSPRQHKHIFPGRNSTDRGTSYWVKNQVSYIGFVSLLYDHHPFPFASEAKVSNLCHIFTTDYHGVRGQGRMKMGNCEKF